ncbi:unnamed protein product, partial [marine sediment metagenome]
EATDWQIVEEKKTLSDKIGGYEVARFVYVKDVKEAIKNIKEDIDKECNANTPEAHIMINAVRVNSIIDKRVGERLI